MTFVMEMAEQITRELDAIIADVCPGAGRRKMYGGFVFETEPGNPATMICGHFVYKNHVGLEFSNGHQLQDAAGVLEGKGKYRRHIKLRRPEDVSAKHVRSVIEQAFS